MAFVDVALAIRVCVLGVYRLENFGFLAPLRTFTVYSEGKSEASEVQMESTIIIILL